MKLNFLFLFLMIIISFSAYSKAGAGSSGGGDANSKRARILKSYFTVNKDNLTTNLTKIANSLNNLESQGHVMSQIQTLVKNGLTQDFLKAKYELHPACFDDRGIERSASTTRLDLSFAGQSERNESPAICINIRKLAEENASYEDVLGLLFHEHARHFGLEDIDETGAIYPIAEFVANNFEAFRLLTGSEKSVASAALIEKRSIRIPSLKNDYEQEILNFISPKNSLDVAVHFNEMNGDCSDLTIKSGALLTEQNTSRELPELAIKNSESEKISIHLKNFSDDNFSYLYNKNVLVLSLEDKSFIGNTPLSLFKRTLKCSVKFNLIIDGESTKEFEVNFNRPGNTTSNQIRIYFDKLNGLKDID